MGRGVDIVRFATAGATGFVVVHTWALLGAIWHYRCQCVATDQRATPTGFWRHLLPRELLQSPWTRLDLILLGVHKLWQLVVFQFVVGGTIGVAAAVSHLLGAIRAAGLVAPNIVLGGVFLLVGLAARDFASFYMHYLQHKIPLLWEFHKVHHAPETLIPATARRLHPIDELANLVAESVMLGSLIGMQAWLTGAGAVSLLAAATTLYVLVNMLTFSPLRHSQIDLRLGWLERVVFSPAHHQMHHSSEREHWDRNFGSICPIWDRLWGTFLTPQPWGSYRLGLPERESEAYRTILGCYVTPVRRAGRLLLRRPAPVVQARAVGPHDMLARGDVMSQTSSAGVSVSPFSDLRQQRL